MEYIIYTKSESGKQNKWILNTDMPLEEVCKLLYQSGLYEFDICKTENNMSKLLYSLEKKRYFNE